MMRNGGTCRQKREAAEEGCSQAGVLAVGRLGGGALSR